MLAAMLQDNLQVEHDECEVLDANVQTMSNPRLASTTGLYSCMPTVTI